MKAVLDPDRVLATGLAAIRSQYQVPRSFPDSVLEAARSAAVRPLTDHIDRTDIPFVTLDPASATDLDQAFAIEASGQDLLLRYAIADVAWFVEDGDPVDAEAWHRGTTLYLPDGKASLYPPGLSEAAASLLPDGPRPAILFTVRVAPHGEVTLEGAERAVIRSRAKLAYETVIESQLPPQFSELARRIARAEAARGASRVDPPNRKSPAAPAAPMRSRFATGTHPKTAMPRFRWPPILRSPRRLPRVIPVCSASWPSPMPGLSSACATPPEPSTSLGRRRRACLNSGPGSTPPILARQR